MGGRGARLQEYAFKKKKALRNGIPHAVLNPVS
jgi:hypothetical protein